MKKLVFVLGLIAIISCSNSNRQKIMSSILSDYIIRYVENDTCMYKACLDISKLYSKSMSGENISNSEWKLADSAVSKAYNKNVNALNMYIVTSIDDITDNFNTHNLFYDDSEQLKIGNDFAIDNIISAAKESGNSQDIPALIEMKSKL